ncbi:MAG: flagellar hook-length control protein FliK [Ignavibacteria bacterium]|jgi:flagellar hook-length control protein FliK
MLFNPLFIQNSPAEGTANLNQNKLNPNGYLFSDIINVYMGNEEEVEGQVNGLNGKNVETVVLNLEKEIPISTDSESIKNKFAQLEKYLLKFSSDTEQDASASEVKVENRNVSLKEVKDLLANLVDTESEDESAEINDEKFADIINKLNKGDGISITFVGEKQVVNINISKDVAEDLGKLSQESSTKVFQLNFSIVHDNQNNSLSENEKISQTQILSDDQSTVEFSSKPSLKIYSYQKNDEQAKNSIIDITKLPSKPEDMYTSTRSVNNQFIFNEGEEFVEVKTNLNSGSTANTNVIEKETQSNKEVEVKSAVKQTSENVEYTSGTKPNQKSSGLYEISAPKKDEGTESVNTQYEKKIAESKDFIAGKESQTESIKIKHEATNQVKLEEKTATENKVSESSTQKEVAENTKNVTANKGYVNRTDLNVEVRKTGQSNTITLEGNDKKSAVDSAIKNEKATLKKSDQLSVESEENKVEQPKIARAGIKENVKSQTTTANKINADIKSESESIKTVADSGEKSLSKEEIKNENLRDLTENKVKVENKNATTDFVTQEKKEGKTNSENTVKNISSTAKEENTTKVDIKENIKSKETVENNTKAEFNTKTEEAKTGFSNQQNLSQQNDGSKQTAGTFNSVEINPNNNAEKTAFELPQNQTADKIIKSTEVLKEISNFIQKGDKTSIEFQIEPEQLGKLKIMLDISEQAVKANIKVESEAVKYLVENNMQDLQNHLNKQGIQLSSVNISLSDNNSKDAKSFTSKKKNQTEVKNPKAINSEEEEKVARMLGYNTIEYLA